MMKKLVIALAVSIATLSTSMSVLASENCLKDVNINETETIVLCSEESLTLDNFEVAKNIEVTDLIANRNMEEIHNIIPKVETQISTTMPRIAPDQYEPNDTIDTAYNYDLIPELDVYLYNMGFKSANLHTVTDEDWYYTTLTAGNIYFLDLRNIGDSDYNISLFFFNEDGTMDYLTSVGDTRFTQHPEKYYYVQPNKSGRYYVCITGNGTTTSTMNYFFYIGNAQRSFTYSGPVGTPISIFGDTYQTGKNLDLSKAVVPYDSVVLSMSFSNDFSGTICPECQKRSLQKTEKRIIVPVQVEQIL